MISERNAYNYMLEYWKRHEINFLLVATAKATNQMLEPG